VSCSGTKITPRFVKISRLDENLEMEVRTDSCNLTSVFSLLKKGEKTNTEFCVVSGWLQIRRPNGQSVERIPTIAYIITRERERESAASARARTTRWAN
jgi:hypothetical protein